MQPPDTVWTYWYVMMQLLQYMERQVLDAAVQADPQRAAGVVHTFLAATAAAQGSRDNGHLVVADFVSRVLLHNITSFSKQQLQLGGSIEGLPATLADCVPRLVTSSQERKAMSDEFKLAAIPRLLWLLELVLEHAPAGEQQCLTPQQLERMQLLPLIRQQPLHGATPEESWHLARLHWSFLYFLSFTIKPMRQGRDQLLQRYWADGGVHQLQVSAALACSLVHCWLLACSWWQLLEA